MGLGYSEGGIATLKNKKKTNTQKIASVYNNPGFKYWEKAPKRICIKRVRKYHQNRLRKSREHIWQK